MVDNVAQLAVIHPYLPTHWWLSFDSLLRAPGRHHHPAARAAVVRASYMVIFGSFAWARFTCADVTS